MFSLSKSFIFVSICVSLIGLFLLFGKGSYVSTDFPFTDWLPQKEIPVGADCTYQYTPEYTKTYYYCRITPNVVAFVSVYDVRMVSISIVFSDPIYPLGLAYEWFPDQCAGRVRTRHFRVLTCRGITLYAVGAYKQGQYDLFHPIKMLTIRS